MNELIKINKQNINGSEVNAVTSKQIAEHFDKRHGDVLRVIKNLEVPDMFRQRNFALSSYLDSQGIKRPIQNMSKDGFSLVVMGFTGKTANEWKIKYIEAFNKMEQYIIKNQIPDFSNPAEAARAWADQYEHREIAEKKSKKLQLQIQEQKPLVEYVTKTLESKYKLTMSSVASNINMTAQRANKLLNELKVLKKVDNTWLLRAEYLDKGLADLETYTKELPDGKVVTKQNLKWSEKGKKFVIELLTEK